ncbi:MAG: hypothetical protein QF412_03685 [Planctomycetota bacterium]|nr:hypothetical protein [Planctomycetota bacterium]
MTPTQAPEPTHEQTSLPFPEPVHRLAAQHWQDILGKIIGCRVEVTYGRSRTKPVHAQQEAATFRTPVLHVRLHEFFASAPAPVQDAMGRWLKSGRRARAACDLLDRWIDARLAELPPRKPRRQTLESCGTHHDLQELADDLFAKEFARDFDKRSSRPALSWGQRRRSRTRHSLQLGVYDADTHIIRVHPILDRSDVPSWYVRAVLFHEILHAVLPPVKSSDGRWIRHGKEFRTREHAHPDTDRARTWESDNLPRLIRLARRQRSKQS